jgi:predicted nuclease of predicted toxin-antitoxin system
MSGLHRAKHRQFNALGSAELKAARSEWRRFPKTRFLTDANMEPWALYVMRYEHLDVRPCDFAGIRYADDQSVFASAWKLGRLLITHDADFLDDRQFPFSRCSGLLHVPTYNSVSMEFANLLAGACRLVSRGGRLWFHTKIVARRDFTVKVRTWDKAEGHITEWNHRIPSGYRKAAQIVRNS